MNRHDFQWQLGPWYWPWYNKYENEYLGYGKYGGFKYYDHFAGIGPFQFRWKTRK